jgi:hypothetical protein
MSILSKHIRLLLTLGSELALLLVARGESDTLSGLPLVDPDRALCTDDAGMLVIRGRKLFGMLRRMSCAKLHLSFNLTNGVILGVR